jgi:hypothetical protein
MTADMVAPARSPREHDANGREPALGEHVAARHVDRSLDEVGAFAAKPADANLRIGVKTVAHILPAAEIAAFAFLEDQLGDRRRFGGVANGLRQSTAFLPVADERSMRVGAESIGVRPSSAPLARDPRPSCAVRLHS